MFFVIETFFRLFHQQLLRNNSPNNQYQFIKIVFLFTTVYQTTLNNNESNNNCSKSKILEKSGVICKNSTQ